MPQLRPLVVDDVAPVADELAGEQRRGRLRHQLRRLVLLDHVGRLALRAAQGRVVGREGEVDDEAEQDGEARREHAEDPGRAVAVGEEAPGRGEPAQQEEQADRDGDGGEDDREGEEQVHRPRFCPGFRRRSSPRRDYVAAVVPWDARGAWPSQARSRSSRGCRSWPSPSASCSSCRRPSCSPTSARSTSRSRTASASPSSGPPRCRRRSGSSSRCGSSRTRPRQTHGRRSTSGRSMRRSSAARRDRR